MSFNLSLLRRNGCPSTYCKRVHYTLGFHSTMTHHDYNAFHHTHVLDCYSVGFLLGFLHHMMQNKFPIHPIQTSYHQLVMLTNPKVQEKQNKKRVIKLQKYGKNTSNCNCTIVVIYFLLGQGNSVHSLASLDFDPLDVQ